jgi:hypothetical protein
MPALSWWHALDSSRDLDPCVRRSCADQSTSAMSVVCRIVRLLFDVCSVLCSAVGDTVNTREDDRSLRGGWSRADPESSHKRLKDVATQRRMGDRHDAAHNPYTMHHITFESMVRSYSRCLRSFETRKRNACCHSGPNHSRTRVTHHTAKQVGAAVVIEEMLSSALNGLACALDAAGQCRSPPDRSVRLLVVIRSCRERTDSSYSLARASSLRRSP